MTDATGGDACGMCGARVAMPCRSTRDMEDRHESRCLASLMVLGGGEYTANRIEAGEWLRAMETAVSAERETWAQPVVTYPRPHSKEAAVFSALAEAGFAVRDGDGWRLTERGMRRVLGEPVPWLETA